MKKYYVVLSDEEKEIIERETEKWFDNTTRNWTGSQADALDLFRVLFINGTDILLPNGASVHVKITAEKFKQYIGESEYAVLKDTCIAEGKALACAVATEVIVWQWIKVAMAVASGPAGAMVVWICGFAVDYALAMMVYNTMKEVFSPKMTVKEVKVDDQGVQEAC